jgi:hypothetical protein
VICYEPAKQRDCRGEVFSLPKTHGSQLAGKRSTPFPQWLKPMASQAFIAGALRPCRRQARSINYGSGPLKTDFLRELFAVCVVFSPAASIAKPLSVAAYFCTVNL